MFDTPVTRRTTARAACTAAAVLLATCICIGTSAAQAGDVTVTITNDGTQPISINIKELSDYREDLDAGETKSVPPENLTGVDPTNTDIEWEAHLRDLKSVDQPAPNPVCASGVIIFEGNAGHVDVTKCG
jgi:hypothetical protein